MWKPEQLLEEEVVATLRQAGYTENVIEFLGWLSYTSRALNNSKNCAKAANTLLAKENIVKMVKKFVEKKKKSVKIENAVDTEEADKLFRGLAKFEEQNPEIRPRKVNHELEEDGD